MELNKEFNENYNKDKSAYQKLKGLKENLKKIENEIKSCTRLKEDFEKRKQRAIEDKDKNAEKIADNNIKLVDENLKKLKNNLEKSKNLLNINKQKVEGYLNELGNDSEFMIHVNSILEKRYNRKIKVVTAEKQQIDLIITLLDKHPQLQNNLKGMIRASEEITKLNEELKTLDPIKDKDRIDDVKKDLKVFNDKKVKNKDIFEKVCEKNNVNIDIKILEKIIKEKAFAHDKKTGEIKLEKSLKNISKGYDKQINVYKKSIEKIPGAKVFENKEGKEETSTETPVNNLPAKSIKWWQFGKRFNAWRETRRVKKEDKKLQKIKEEKGEEISKNFRDSYKYEVVQDFVKLREKDIAKQVNNEMKNKTEDQQSR